VLDGKLLCFIISSHDIEVNTEKVKAIKHMQAPTYLKEEQHLTRCMAALGQFISKLGERDLSLFKLLKKARWFEWTEKEEQAFQDLKEYLSFPRCSWHPGTERSSPVNLSHPAGCKCGVAGRKREERR